MSEVINPLDREAVYKEIQQQIKQYKGPVEFGVVKAQGMINVYTDRGMAMPFLITSEGEPYTWRTDFQKQENNETSEDYGRYIFETMLNNSLRRGSKVNFPSRKKILQSKQMTELRSMFPDMTDIEIAKYVIYGAVSGQACKSCGIGWVECEVGSYAEFHRCINCGNCFSVT